jgi:hypothetical protein
MFLTSIYQILSLFSTFPQIAGRKGEVVEKGRKAKKLMRHHFPLKLPEVS